MEDKVNEYSITQKQDLLKKEIIDDKYDKDAFLDYCLARKENGDDLESWTYDELVEIVSSFKKSLNLNEELTEKVKVIKKEEINVNLEKIKIYV
jgi:hypothetical protein